MKVRHIHIDANPPPLPPPLPPVANDYGPPPLPPQPEKLPTFMSRGEDGSEQVVASLSIAGYRVPNWLAVAFIVALATTWFYLAMHLFSWWLAV